MKHCKWCGADFSSVDACLDHEMTCSERPEAKKQRPEAKKQRLASYEVEFRKSPDGGFHRVILTPKKVN